MEKISGKKILKLAGDCLNMTCDDVCRLSVQEIVNLIRSLSASVVSQAEMKEKTGEKLNMATKSKAKAKPKTEAKTKAPAKSKAKKK